MTLEGESKQTEVEKRAKLFVEKGIPGDAWNNVGTIIAELRHPTTDEELRVASYEGYIRNSKFRDEPEVAEAVIAATDKGAMSAYNAIVERMNQILRDQTTTEAKVAALRPLLEEIRAVLRNQQ